MSIYEDVLRNTIHFYRISHGFPLDFPSTSFHQHPERFAQRLAVPPALPAAHHVDLELDGGLIREDLRAGYGGKLSSAD